MKLTDQLTDYVNAAFAGIWVETREPDEAEREIVRHARQKHWRIAVWDIASGIRLPEAADEALPKTGADDPLAAIRALPTFAVKDGTAILLVHNLQRFLNNPEVIQAVFNQLVVGKQQRTFVIVLAPIVQIPVELEKLFVVVEHSLPDRDQLRQIARELTTEDPASMPMGDELERVLDAASGLTRYEAEGAYSLSIARHNAIRPSAIWDLKVQALRKGGLVTLHRGKESFKDLGGLQNMKDFCRRALAPGHTSVKPRGTLLLGVPGSGKSAFARARQRDRPAHVDPRPRGPLRFASRRHRGKHPAGPQDRRRHGALHLLRR